MPLSLKPEWPTLGAIAGAWTAWTLLVGQGAVLGGPLAALALAVVLAFHSSLQHEAMHGHPTRLGWLNTACVIAPLGLFIPYHRFRALHLAHHRSPHLTDPYDDPESYYLPAGRWSGCPLPLRWLLLANTTLLGRVAFGPALGLAGFWRSEIKAIAAGDRAVARVWAVHGMLVAVLALILQATGSVSWWTYLAGCYGALSIVAVRTFAEHRAHGEAGARTAVVEDRGPLALLFLNNNLHAAHHLRPSLAWYELPAFYRRNRERILAGNRHYRFASYAAVFRLYAVTPKEPVVHPLAVPGTGQ